MLATCGQVVLAFGALVTCQCLLATMRRAGVSASGLRLLQPQDFLNIHSDDQMDGRTVQYLANALTLECAKLEDSLPVYVCPQRSPRVWAR